MRLILNLLIQFTCLFWFSIRSTSTADSGGGSGAIISNQFRSPDTFINDYHFPMVVDEVRNGLFYEALRKVINLNNQSRVLDVGAGTMLLSMMSLDLGAASVLGVEANPSMIQVAKSVLHTNNFSQDLQSGRVQLFEGKFETLHLGHHMFQAPANVFVSETFDAALIGEGFLSILSHAKTSGLLTSDAVIIPSSAVIFGQLLESTLSLPRGRNNTAFRAAGGRYNLEPMRSYRPASVYTVRYLNEQNAVRQRLSKPYALFNYDFQNFQAPEMTFAYTCLLFKITEATEGVFDSIGLWFNLHLDAEKQLVVSNAPDPLDSTQQQQQQHSAPCWMQAIYRVSTDVAVKRGDVLRLQIVQLQQTNVIGAVGMGTGNRDSRLVNFIAHNCHNPVLIYAYRNDPFKEIESTVELDGSFQIGSDDRTHEYVAGTIPSGAGAGDDSGGVLDTFEIVAARIHQRFKLATLLPSGRRMGMWYQVPDSSLKFTGSATARARKKIPLDSFIVDCTATSS